MSPGDIAVLVAEFAGFVLLPKFLVSRVESAAKGQVDESVGKALAGHSHELETQLERYRATLTNELEKVRQALALDRERYSRDYALFATRRNEVYAETFGALQKAIGNYAAHFAVMTSQRHYSGSPEADLRHVAARLEHITAAEREELVAAIDAGRLADAGTIATTLYERDSVRQAQFSFFDFKRMWVLNALYYSAGVDTVLHEAIKHLAGLSFDADELIDGRRVDRVKAAERLQQVEEANARLKTVMRAELQAGFSEKPTEK